jgi:uncharacterized membrane protein HdeD (DUF308 family)
MTETNAETRIPAGADQVRANWGWLMFMGIALAGLGIAGTYMTGVLTLVSVLYIGIMVLAGGILVLIDAFKAEGWKAKLMQILIALAYVVAGLVMIVNPAGSAVWFTLFIAGFLLTSGVFRIVMGFQIRGEVNGWVFTVLGGIASLVLAVMIFSQWPVSGLWVIGLFAAIEMLIQGLSMISIAMAAKASNDQGANAAS